MSLLLCLFVSLLSLSCVADNPCRQDWELFGESCYAFGEEAVTWADAQEVCRSAGARLVEIETSEENEFLKNQARQRGTQLQLQYWAGGTDILHEGSWVWISSGNLLHPFEDWYPGQPNNDHGTADCVYLAVALDYQWNDAPCDTKLRFICEAPLEETVVG